MEDELKKLLKQNLELTEETHKMVKSIRNYVIGQRIWFVIKLLLIAVPIVLGFIYLPAIFKDLFSQYQSLLGSVSEGSNIMESLMGGGAGLDLNNIDVNNLPPDLKKYLK